MLGAYPTLISAKESSVDEKLATIWGSRNEIDDHHNLLVLEFEGNYSVEFRAYNTGVAYRFVTRLKEKQVTVQNEEVAYRFKFGVSAWLRAPNYH